MREQAASVAASRLEGRGAVAVGRVALLVHGKRIRLSGIAGRGVLRMPRRLLFWDGPTTCVLTCALSAIGRIAFSLHWGSEGVLGQAQY